MNEKSISKIVPTSLQPIALALHQGNWQAVAQAVMKCHEVSSLVTDILLKRIQAECEQLCSSSRKSLMRMSSPDDLESFSWHSLVSELKQKAPLLFAFLAAAGAPPRPRNVRKGATEKSRYPALCMAAAVLLKERCYAMSALQHLVGLILFDGNASKLVCYDNSNSLLYLF